MGDSLAQVAEDRIIAFRNATGHFWQEDNIPHSWMTPDTLIENTHRGAADFGYNESWFARLQAVKTRVDSTDLFHSQMTIPPLASASAVGDPHLQNVRGERFDLMQPGRHTLIYIPKWAKAPDTLLRVEADAERLGTHCADLYFLKLNVTGDWAEAMRKGGLQFHAGDTGGKQGSKWMSIGKVDLKVVHGHTQEGTQYLNLYARHLGRAGLPVGGLLGEDDHTAAEAPSSSCVRSIAFWSRSGAASPSAPSASVAEALPA